MVTIIFLFIFFCVKKSNSVKPVMSGHCDERHACEEGPYFDYDMFLLVWNAISISTSSCVHYF